MFTDWDDSLDVNFDSLDSNDFLEDAHSPFYLERAIMNFNNDSPEFFDSYVTLVKKENYLKEDDPVLNEDWHRLRRIIHHEDLWPHLDDFLITIPDWAICNVCSELFKHPLKWLPCEHNFCKDCICNLTKYGHFECPLCLCKLPSDVDMLSLTRDDNLIRRIGNLKARCRWSMKLNKIRKKKDQTLTGSLGSHDNTNSNASPTIRSYEEYMIHYSACEWIQSEDGCDETVNLSNLVRHHLECRHRPTLCKNKECGIYVPYYKLDEHMKKCIHQIIQCINCNECFAAKDEELHINTCPKESIQCDSCKYMVHRQDMTSHLRIECPMKIIQCPYFKYGCKYECTRSEMDNHLNNCTFETMKDFISSVTRRLDECEKIIRSQKEKISRLEWTIESQNIDNGGVDHRRLSRMDSHYDDYLSQNFF